MTADLAPATKPTMYFIGVSTRHSSIHRVLPAWADKLQLGDCELRGLDFPLDDCAGNFRAAVEFIRRDPLSMGALVTTHKVDLFAAAADLFDVIDPLARELGEISSLYKRKGRLYGRAVDPWSAGAALAAFLPEGHWRQEAEVLILGAGGAGCALAWHLSQPGQGGGRPKRIHVADRRSLRLDHLRRLHTTWSDAPPLECHDVLQPEATDRLLANLLPGSLVVNATGMGKDVPGSPLTDAAVFPEGGWVWDFNYRGDLRFLDQARAQKRLRALKGIEDGWVYFLHGWLRVIADVFDRTLPERGPAFEELGGIARRVSSA